MFDFLKTLGEGVLYTLLSPILLLILIVHMAIYVIVFFIMFIKRIILFFQGKDMSIDSELDRAAKYHMDAYKKSLLSKDQDTKQNQNQVPPMPQTTIVQPIIIQTGADGSIKATNLNPQQDTRQERDKQDPIDFTKNTKEISYSEIEELEYMEDQENDK